MYTRLNFDDKVTGKLEKLVEMGEFRVGESGRLRAGNPQGAKNTPWIFLNHNTRHKFCGLWNSIYCGQFKLIPTPCRFSCWKTVIKPRTVEELFHVHDVLRATGLPSKCGADLRKYTFGPWAGFVYADTLEEGRRYYRTVRKVISDDIPIILKRGCTEMERLKPSNTWDQITQAEVRLEERLNDVFEFTELFFQQAEWLKARIKERWIERAIEIGDPTAQHMAMVMSGGDLNLWQRLVVHSVEYQEEGKGEDENKP